MKRKSALSTVNKFFLLFILFIHINISWADQNHDLFDKLIKDYMVRNPVPGLAVSIVKKDKILWSKAYGYGDIEKSIPMTTRSIINIASISKTITATAIMQLWEQGKLDIDADINKYLSFSVRNPKFPKTSITVRQLLTHTSSINDSNEYSSSYKCGDPVVALGVWIGNYFRPTGKYYNKDENFHSWKPGEDYEYSNVAFGLLAYLVQKISKNSFDHYVKANILNPLGMADTGWFISKIDTQKHVKSYVLVDKKSKKNQWLQSLVEKEVKNYYQLCPYSFYNYPDGLLRTNVIELSSFLSTIMNGGIFNNHKILKTTTIEKMLSPQVNENNWQGLCLKRFGSLWGHSGGDPGVQTRMLFDKEAGIGLIIFQNSGDGNSFKLLQKLYSFVKDERKNRK